MANTVMVMTGTIRKLKATEGFGFIRGEDGTDRFFHKSSVVGGVEVFDELAEGQRVSFVHQDGQKDKRTGELKGPRAIDVRV